MDLEAPVRIAHLIGKNATVTGLKVKGRGSLNVCLVEFYQEGEPGIRHKELFFHLPNYEQSKTLPPRKGDFKLSGFDFCEVKVLTGSLLPGDEISLAYNLVKDK